jgi:hypothetical protein
LGNNKTSAGRSTRSNQVGPNGKDRSDRSHRTTTTYTRRNKEREKEELAEKHEAEMKLYKQKVKHLMYEHQTNLSETKAEYLAALKMARDDHAAQENEIIKDKSESKKLQKEQELAHTNEIRTLKLVRCTHNWQRFAKLVKCTHTTARARARAYGVCTYVRMYVRARACTFSPHWSLTLVIVTREKHSCIRKKQMTWQKSLRPKSRNWSKSTRKN